MSSAQIPLSETARLLLVEDDPEVGHGLKDYFSLWEFQVEVVSQGCKVVEAIKAFSPDVVLLDVRLPEKDGFEVLQDVQEEEIDLPILILTVLSKSKYVHKALRLGATGYVTKPFDLEDLLSRVRAAIRE